MSEETVARLWSSAKDQETFLCLLREHGASKIESIKSLRHVAKIGLGEAKEAVHFSPIWKDRRVSDDTFHESVFQAFDLLKNEVKQDPERLAG